MGDVVMRRLEATIDLLRLPLETSERDALLAAIDLAVDLTDSRIGYLHYLNDDQVTIELSTWSTTTRDYCTASYDRHYPLDVAGIWADTARTRSAHVHNDYPSAPGRKGLPEGHSVLHRHLGVAAVADGRVRLLLGVGNKQDPYGDDDVDSAQLIADVAWLVIDRLRTHQSAVRDLDVLRGRQVAARLATFVWDPDRDELAWDNQGVPLLDVSIDSWNTLLAKLDDPSRDRLSRALDRGPEGPAMDLDLRVPGPAGIVTLRLRGEWVTRQQGLGHSLRGSVMDVSLEEEAERSRYRATHDPLTGLPNRAWLLDEITRRLASPHRRDDDAFAVHFVDLDDFKGVNDEYGHLVGDDVLRTCADRIASVVRSGSVAARLGGDEFVVLQPHPDLALADSIVSAMARPMQVAGIDLRIGASIGVAISGPDDDARGLLARADRALYEAKRSRRTVVVDRPPARS